MHAAVTFSHFQELKESYFQEPSQWKFHCTGKAFQSLFCESAFGEDAIEAPVSG